MKTIIALAVSAFLVNHIYATPESDELRTHQRILLNKRVQRITMLWPNRIEDYCNCYRLLITDVKRMVKSPEDVVLLEDIALPLLEKSNPESISRLPYSFIYLWRAQADVIEALLVTSRRMHVPDADKTHYASLTAAFIERINNEIIPEYKLEPHGNYSVSIGGSDKQSDDARKELRKLQKQAAVNNAILSKNAFFENMLRELESFLASDLNQKNEDPSIN